MRAALALILLASPVSAQQQIFDPETGKSVYIFDGMSSRGTEPSAVDQMLMNPGHIGNTGYDDAEDRQKQNQLMREQIENLRLQNELLRQQLKPKE